MTGGSAVSGCAVGSTTETYDSGTPGMPIEVFLEEKASDLDAPRIDIDTFSPSKRLRWVVP